MASRDRPLVHVGPFVVATLAAPASAFLLFVLFAALHGALGPLELGMIAPVLGVLLVVTAWGFLPAALFGGIVLCVLEGRRCVPAPASLLIPGGLIASSLYAFTAWLLVRIGFDWAFLLAPWALAGRENPGFSGNQGEALFIFVAVVASGAAAGLVYAMLSGRLFRAKAQPPSRDPLHPAP
jgi:hypothetical protein